MNETVVAYLIVAVMGVAEPTVASFEYPEDCEVNAYVLNAMVDMTFEMHGFQGEVIANDDGSIIRKGQLVAFCATDLDSVDFDGQTPTVVSSN